MSSNSISDHTTLQATPNVLNKAATAGGGSTSSSSPPPAAQGMSEADVKKFKVRQNSGL